MKKSFLLGTIGISVLVLSGCGNNSSSQKTVDSLKTENSSLNKKIDSLTTENSTMEKKIKIYETIIDADQSGSSSTSDSQSSESSDGIALGEPLELGKDNKKNAEIKIIAATTNQAAFPEHMISMDDYDTTKMVAVKIEYTNVALEENFLPHASYFQAFSEDGKALEQVGQQSGQDAVSIGRTGTTQLYWELPVDGNQVNHIEIDFVPGTTKVDTFSLDVSH